MKILLHSCCGPCSAGVIPQMQAMGEEITAFFYNPNIHPYQEYLARLQSFRDFCLQNHLPAIIKKSYPLEQWLAQVADDPHQRCFYCYESRLEMTAQMAVKHGFEAFSSTLLVSPYQNQEAIRKIGEQIAQKYQIDFYFYDFRPFFRQGQQQARALGLYMQKYCGCIYSEKERYLKVKI